MTKFLKKNFQSLELGSILEIAVVSTASVLMLGSLVAASDPEKVVAVMAIVAGILYIASEIYFVGFGNEQDTELWDT